MEGGELGRRGQVLKCELSWETHGAGGTLECWMVLGGWRASFPLVASDHRHYPRDKRKENVCFLGKIKTPFPRPDNLRKEKIFQAKDLRKFRMVWFLVFAILKHVIIKTATHLNRK